MRTIYLASDSLARKKLLKMLGWKFKVLPSYVREDNKKSCPSYAELVKKNALSKAKDVAKRISSGVVIGADTVVAQNNQIFGKPKDLKDAYRMLKKLTRNPQWVYTGIAIIDKDKGKIRLGCERTKVYMDRLTDREIKNYFRDVSPLDKAGSFDIQGKGALFIRRIEGCFYNVVGLPLRRIYCMLKDLGVKISLLIFFLLPFSCLVLFGCSAEYNIVTGKEEVYFYSTDKEVQIGRSIAKEIENKYKLVDDPLILKRAEEIGNRIASVCDRRDVDY
ncbi:MAG: Maf family protein, partial [Candidatus Omnitrophica bacterium]|nr:Maf family protein [Candidatus Omnitrophota bacterium]